MSKFRVDISQLERECFDCDKEVYIEDIYSIISDECEDLENGDTKEISLYYDCNRCDNSGFLEVEVTRYDNVLEVENS